VLIAAPNGSSCKAFCWTLTGLAAVDVVLSIVYKEQLVSKITGKFVKFTKILQFVFMLCIALMSHELDVPPPLLWTLACCMIGFQVANCWWIFTLRWWAWSPLKAQLDQQRALIRQKQLEQAAELSPGSTKPSKLSARQQAEAAQNGSKMASPRSALEAGSDEATPLKTTLRSPAKAGSKKLDVNDQRGFQEGDWISIEDPITNAKERACISGFSSILLQDPLKRTYGIGSTITRVDEPNASQSPDKQQADASMTQQGPQEPTGKPPAVKGFILGQQLAYVPEVDQMGSCNPYDAISGYKHDVDGYRVERKVDHHDLGPSSMPVSSYTADNRYDYGPPTPSPDPMSSAHFGDQPYTSSDGFHQIAHSRQPRPDGYSHSEATAGHHVASYYDYDPMTGGHQPMHSHDQMMGHHNSIAAHEPMHSHDQMMGHYDPMAAHVPIGRQQQATSQFTAGSHRAPSNYTAAASEMDMEWQGHLAHT
jgi:hypothetical protein